MMEDKFYQAFVAAWNVSCSAHEVGRRLGGVLTESEVRQVARHLKANGVHIPPQPDGAATEARVAVTPHPATAGEYVDGDGREAYRVGPLAPPRPWPKEGPWTCSRCKTRSSGGVRLRIGPGHHPFVCGRCAWVVD